MTPQFTLTLNVAGLITQDSQYLLQVRADAIASKANQAVTLSSGGSPVPLDNGFLPLQFFRLQADFNGDNTVDYTDYNLWVAHNSSAVGDPSYDPIYDLDGNGVIDRFDYAIWRHQLGKTVDTTPPTIGAQINPVSGAAPRRPTFSWRTRTWRPLLSIAAACKARR